MSVPRRRVLLIAYQFPPVGGAGVQRVAKFTRYLPEHGWNVSVLTVSNPSVPLVDESLMADIPASTVIRRARTWEPGYQVKQNLVSGSGPAVRTGWRHKLKQMLRRAATTVLQPDPQILWVPNAIRAGRKLLGELQHDAILVSGPPFSSFFVGAALRRSSRLPLVLDYRDEWSISNRYWENKSRGPLVERTQRAMQRWVIRHADALLATTQRSAATLLHESKEIGGPDRVRCLYNGFDPSDLSGGEGEVAIAEPRRYRIAHVGTLWNLTTARGLVAAVEQLSRQRPDLAARLDLEFVGRCTPAERSLLERLAPLPCRVLQRDYVDHSTAVQVMTSADELALILADVPGADRVLPGKTFEYLATGRSILTLAPPGELRDVVAPYAGVTAFAPGETDKICDYLAQRLSRVSAPRTYSRDVSRFDRREQAGELARWLDFTVADFHGQPIESCVASRPDGSLKTPDTTPCQGA